MLLGKNIEEQKEWCKSLGFTSQAILFNEAEEELEELTELNSFEEFRPRYDQFKEEYSKYFLFNNNEKDMDLSFYLPSNAFGYSMVCNPDGNVMVAGVVKNFNNLNSYTETQYYKAEQEARMNTRSIEESLNRVYIKHDKRKMWATAERYMLHVHMNLRAHKKTMFGWNSYSTEYHIRYINHDPFSWTLLEHLRYFIENAPSTCVTKELSSGTLLLLGNTQYNISAGKVITKGVCTLEVHSRGTGDEKGILKVSI